MEFWLLHRILNTPREQLDLPRRNALLFGICDACFGLHCLLVPLVDAKSVRIILLLLIIIVESNVFVSQYSVQNQTRKVLFGDAPDFLTAIVVRIVSISLRRRRIPTGEVREQEKRKQVLANRWAILVVLVVVVMVVAVAESGTARDSGRRQRRCSLGGLFQKRTAAAISERQFVLVL